MILDCLIEKLLENLLGRTRQEVVSQDSRLIGLYPYTFPYPFISNSGSVSRATLPSSRLEMRGMNTKYVPNDLESPIQSQAKMDIDTDKVTNFDPQTVAPDEAKSFWADLNQTQAICKL